ncbi:unnamed protein product [Soboliphyme baturini]|uniref:Ig-like domain-containing protein n=1 Tax=Soboliphyme baturini TaxID=241478 RepID=A0A183IH18_9BILA|nr:unnamed protein product [Soboliphyme baturini]
MSLKLVIRSSNIPDFPVHRPGVYHRAFACPYFHFVSQPFRAVFETRPPREFTQSVSSKPDLKIVQQPCFWKQYVPEHLMNPRFRTHVRTKVDVMLGDRLKLRCDAVGKPKPYVHWYRNNELIPSARSLPRMKINPYSLTIIPVQPDDEDKYSCKVWNQVGQIWRNFTVRIMGTYATQLLVQRISVFRSFVSIFARGLKRLKTDMPNEV